MPVMNGETAFYKLKKINSNIKIVISTGYENNNKIQDLLTAGAVGLLKKPYKIKSLAEILNKLIF